MANYNISKSEIPVGNEWQKLDQSEFLLQLAKEKITKYKVITIVIIIITKLCHIKMQH